MERRNRKITSPGYSIDPADGGGQDPRLHVCPGFVGCLFNNQIPHSGDKFLIFYVSQLSCAIHSSRPFWKCVRGLQGSLAVLIHCYSPRLLLNLIPVLALYYVVLISPQARTRTFVPGKCCPTSVWPPSPASSCSFSQCYYQQSLVVITTNPWLAPQLSGSETYNTHQPLIFYRNM